MECNQKQQQAVLKALSADSPSPHSTNGCSSKLAFVWAVWCGLTQSKYKQAGVACQA
jgi:hypothetical protein